MASVEKTTEIRNRNTTYKKSIAELIKVVFKEEFQKQHQGISKGISNKLTITKQDIRKLREEINDPKKVPNLLKMFSKIKFLKFNRTFAS